MPLYGPDAFVKRIADGFYLSEQWQAENRASLVTFILFNAQVVWKYTVPSMPSGVDAFIPAVTHFNGSGPGTLMLVKRISLGSLDIGTNVFTDGAVMPTVTELGVSRQVAGTLWAEVDTALNATPGSISVTYKDQDGNAAQATVAVNMGASTQPRSGSPVGLAAPDWGVTDVTSAVRSGGTTPSGVVRFYGLIPVGIGIASTGVNNMITQSYLAGGEYNPVRFAAGDELAIIQTGQAATAHAIAGWTLIMGDTA